MLPGTKKFLSDKIRNHFLLRHIQAYIAAEGGEVGDAPVSDQIMKCAIIAIYGSYDLEFLIILLHVINFSHI